MQKIIEEILKENKNLDKKNLEKIIKDLTNINPKITIDSKFKNDLKNRLESIIDYKMQKKNNYFSMFFAPVFSVFFVAVGFFYFYEDINFINNDSLKFENQMIQEDSIKDNSPITPLNKGDENILEEIKDENIVEILENNSETINTNSGIKNKKIEEIEKFKNKSIKKNATKVQNKKIIENNNSKVKTKENRKNDVKKTKSIVKEENTSLEIENKDLKIKSTSLKSSEASLNNKKEKGEKKINLDNRNSDTISDEELMENDEIELNNNNDDEIEDTQIIDILGEGDNSDIDSVDTESLDYSEPQNVSSDSVPDTSEYYDNGENTEPYINTFQEYCQEYNSKILTNEDGKKYCIVEKKICLESNYSNNNCKLTEK